MKGREGKGPPSTDLLVCFPSRAHLTLMPKPICSPARPPEPNKRQHHPGHHHHPPPPHHHHNYHLLHHRFKKSTNRNKVVGHASPVSWAKTKPYSKEIDEPTSPKVTCAGQVKVKPKASSCKNWQSVMEEIEKLHNHRKHKKKHAWIEALGFKKDVMQFLTCLRSLRFDFRCFGAFHSSAITSDDEDEDEEDDEFHQDHQNDGGTESRGDDQDSETSRTVFSKWFMVLQENNKEESIKKDINKMIKEKFSHDLEEKAEGVDDAVPFAPPPNALLLMRCRSAPAKSWQEEKEEEGEEEVEEEESHGEDGGKENKDLEKKKREEEQLTTEEEKKRKDNLVVMRCGTDFYKFSSDIAKETWVVGGIKEALSRSHSWKT